MQLLNSNILSLNAQNALTRTQADLAPTLQRLSSGLRINSAKDDAAGLAISQRLTAGVRGLDRAAKNVNDAVSLLQVADGAVASIAANYQRIRELTVQAGNSIESSDDRAALQTEINGLVSASIAVANQTEFNHVHLLAGSFSTQFQIGDKAQNTLTIDIPALYKSSTTSQEVTLPLEQVIVTGQVTGALAAGDLVINGVSVGASQAGAASGQTNASAYAVAAAINSVGADASLDPEDHFSASASTTISTTQSAGGAIANNGLVVNGVALGAINGASGALLAASAAAAFTAAAGTSGVTASANGSILTLSAADGRDIVLSDGVAGSAAVLGLSTGTTHGSITLTNTTSAGNSSIVVRGNNPGAAGLARTSYNSAAVGGFGVVTRSSVGTDVNAIDVSTNANVADALDLIDAKIDDISSLRSLLGANQLRLEKAYDSLSGRSTSLAAARSRIVDADYATESAQLMRARILQQAGTAMIAQANSEPRNILMLLR